MAGRARLIVRSTKKRRDDSSCSMVLSQNPPAPPRHSSRCHGSRADDGGAGLVAQGCPRPKQLRRIEDIAITDGAAIGALDEMVRQLERWAGAW